MLGIIALVAISGVYFTSCGTDASPTVNYSYPDTGITNSARIAMKDYTTLGIIIVKSAEVIDGSGNHTGSKITYEMLMVEARRLGADDVINIRIDVNREEEFAPGESLPFKITFNYTASALAIKYTNAIVSSGTANNSQNTEIATIPQNTVNQPNLSEANVSQASSSGTQRARLYLGATVGGGFWDYSGSNRDTNSGTTSSSSYSSSYSDDRDYSYSGGAGGVFGLKVELPLARFFSIDLDIGAEVGETAFGVVTPYVNLLLHVPFRFDSGFNIGAVAGIGAGDPDYLCFIFGPSIGFRIGRGELFLDVITLTGLLENPGGFGVIGRMGYKWAI